MMERLSLTNPNLESRLEEISKLKKKELQSVERAREKELKRVQEQYNGQADSVTQKYDARESEIKEFQTRYGAAELINRLQIDYQVLQGRSNIACLNAEEVRKAKELAKLINTAESDAERKRLLAIMNLSGVSQQVQDAIETVQDGEPKMSCITSYLGYGKPNGSYVIYLVVPVADKDNKTLAETLQDKILNIVGAGEIMVGSQAHVSKTREVIGHVIDSERVNVDYDYSNGFLTFTIEPKTRDSMQVSKIAQSIAGKLEELQPNQFKDSKLVHKIAEVEFPVMNYMVVRSEGRISHEELNSIAEASKGYISVEEAAQILGYTTKGVNHLATRHLLERDANGNIQVASLRKYQASKKKQGKPAVQIADESKISGDEARQQAFQRLDEFGDCLTANDITYVLGYSNPRLVYHTIKEKNIPILHSEQGEIAVSKDNIREYIHTHKFLRRKRR